MALSKGEYERIRKLEKLLKNTSAASKAGLIANYQDTYGKAGKIIKGKWVRWDSRTNKKYDPTIAWKFINLEKYGTETPKEDLKYLRAKDLQIRKEEGPKYNDPLRRKFSRKLVIDDKNEFGTVYDKESSLKIKKDRAKLNELRKQTSFYRLNQSAKTEETKDKATKLLDENKVIEKQVPEENPNLDFIGKDNQLNSDSKEEEGGGGNYPADYNKTEEIQFKKAEKRQREKAPASFEQQLAANLQDVPQRSFGARDTATINSLKAQGFKNADKIDKSVLRDLRIGHAWVTKSGSIRTNPSRGPSLLIKK